MSKRLEQLGDLDLLTEDGYREFTRRAQRLAKDFGLEMHYAAEVLAPALSTLPVLEARTGVMSMGNDSRAAARKVRAYLARAAEAETFAAGQVGAAWTTFERFWLAPQNGKGKPQFQLNAQRTPNRK